jgi:FixJ family two-component response regulator
VANQEQIIVVEDDSSLIHAIQRLLRAAGFEARVFTSAESLLQSGAASGAACFVFDVNLPGLSGVELLQRLVENGIKRPVIFITAHDEPSLRDAAEQYNPEAWLLKPFPGRSLLDALDRAIQPAHARK